ncbi:ATP-binding cassette domain-containing protein [Corynebacterium freiburgense]|uniref:ATP-binding cassette domain-containing protein n=1 Tax=Corynebacterium freiburgense TaxID=556548 RepID=UPI0004264AFB|nr:ATP-binding cassette domain-containing protein [Corynebacterium freiburgense]WJZ02348.1 Putative 2-aminoethylphosphonate import ATP-binding protein PhnT [Corynebacterium freiburgense]
MSSQPLREAKTVMPSVVSISALIAIATVVFPIIALFLRVPWSRFGEIITEPQTIVLIRITVSAALISSAITVFLGIPLALWLQNIHRSISVVRFFVFLPLALPPVVSGLALTAAFGRRGILAPILDIFGIQIGFAFPAVVIAHVFISLPFVVVATDQALRHMDREIITSAAMLGLSPVRLVIQLILPSIYPAIIAGTALALCRSLGEFGTTLTFAGSLPGVTRTMPLGIYLEREIDPERALILAFLLIAFAVSVLLGAGLLVLKLRTNSPLTVVHGVGEAFDSFTLGELTNPHSGGAEIFVQRGHLKASFPRNSTTAIIGPNGAGKTTLANLITGRIHGANTTIRGKPVDGNVLVPMHKRGVVMLSQRHGLPPHLTVYRAIHMFARSPEITRQLIHAAGLQPIANMKISALSGGQAAQVALVRALATKPQTLILDEPFAALDVTAAQRWRNFLRTNSGKRTIIIISHDPVEIASLANSILVLEQGRTVAHKKIEELLAIPPNNFVAQLIGVHRLQGNLYSLNSDTAVLQAGGEYIVGKIRFSEHLQLGTPCLAIVNPEATTVRLDTGGESVIESARNLWKGTITAIETFGSTTELNIDSCGTTLRVPITTASATRLQLEPGSNVLLSTKAIAVSIIPA